MLFYLSVCLFLSQRSLHFLRFLEHLAPSGDVNLTISVSLCISSGSFHFLLMFFLATLPLFHFPLLQWPLDFWGNICKYTLTSCLFMALSAMFFSLQGAQIHQQELRSHSKHTSDFNQRIKEEKKWKNIWRILKILWLYKVYIIKYTVLFWREMVWSLAVSFSTQLEDLNFVQFHKIWTL